MMSIIAASVAPFVASAVLAHIDNPLIGHAASASPATIASVNIDVTIIVPSMCFPRNECGFE